MYPIPNTIQKSNYGEYKEFIKASFYDGMEIKRITFTPRKIKSVYFEIYDVYHGQHYDDTCISEISFFYKNIKIQLKGIAEFKKQLAINKDFSTPVGFMKSDGSMFRVDYLDFPH